MCDKTNEANAEDVGTHNSLGFNEVEKFDVYSLGPSELVIGIVGPMGSKTKKLVEIIEKRLKAYRYSSAIIKISKEVMKILADCPEINEDERYNRIKAYIDLGNRIRSESKNNAILAQGAAIKIAGLRRDSFSQSSGIQKNAYIIDSLKHHDEVAELRKLYRGGFYLFAIHTKKDSRLNSLINDGKRMDPALATELIERDEYEKEEYGQHTRDAFKQADFFLHDDGGDEEKYEQSVWRILDLIFGCPHITPTFDEYAMFMAYSAATRSADLSRQVGAVIAKDKQILSLGANDCPKHGGGLYWPVYDETEKRYVDTEGGRDVALGYDSNAREKQRMIEQIVKVFKEHSDKILTNILDNYPDKACDESKICDIKDIIDNDENTLHKLLKNTQLGDITEYGRVVHAEMEALLACSRSNISSQGASLYCTTFPCHNCAKHIIAAGIKEVTFIEPYPKSKAFEFHKDAISDSEVDGKIWFKPFVGVGPRKYFDLFSMSLGNGVPLIRKNKTGIKHEWQPEHSSVRINMLPIGIEEREKKVAEYIEQLIPTEKNEAGDDTDQ